MWCFSAATSRRLPGCLPINDQTRLIQELGSLMSLNAIKAIAFDADDTLWVNETLFRSAEEEFCSLMKAYIDTDECNKRLFDVEMRNLPMYGYGIKPFTLSLINESGH